MGRNTGTNPRTFTCSIDNEPFSAIASSSSLAPSGGIVPASLAQRYTGDGGLYAGPTSAATFLTLFTNEDYNSQHHDKLSMLTDSARGSPASSSESAVSAASVGPRDLDVLALLPDLSIVDGLINFYFESSTWENRYLDYVSFTNSWFKFKENPNVTFTNGDDRLFLATVFVVMAVSILYLPSRHQLIAPLNTNPNDLAESYYNHSCTILRRYRTERHSYNLEFVELILLHTHFLLVNKDRCEDLWAHRGELMSIACAVGLHRDPSMWKIPKEEAERRRWAWWNILLTDRWSAFLLGRPLGISNHHFDTCMPGPLDPSIDPSQRQHLPLVLIFRLVEILGVMMDDVVSVRPVPHERIMAHDKNLQQWFESFPEELNFDDYQMAKALSSDILSVRREGLISLCMRVMYNHIRFTLHRPYAKPAKYAAAECSTGQGRGITEAQFEISLEIAISAADRVLHHATQAKHDFVANKMLLVPGHLNWGMVHMFNAAMFFVNQILADPEQPGANLFRGNVKRGIVMAESLKGLPVSDKAFSILAALAPLCEEVQNMHNMSEHQLEERENKRKRILSFVQRLSFPCFSNPVHAPVVPSLPMTSLSNNNNLMPFSLGGSSTSASVSNHPGQNSVSSGRNRNNHSTSASSSHGSSTNEMYHSRSFGSARDLLPGGSGGGGGYAQPQSHPSRSPSQNPNAAPNDGNLTRSSVKTPILPPLSQSNSSLSMLNLQLSYQSQQQSQSHGLYPLQQNEHSQQMSSSTSGAAHNTHVHAPPSNSNGHGHNNLMNPNLMNPYLMNGPSHPSHNASSSQGQRHSDVGGNGESGAMWGTSMEVDSSWDGFLSVVPPTE